MNLKTVYGPPPADMERIEAAEGEEENCIREENVADLAAKAPCYKKGDGQGEQSKCV